MTKRPLGRGLSALLSTDSRPVDNEEVLDVQIDLIQPGHQQPRTTFNQAKLDELAQSIRASGGRGAMAHRCGLARDRR